VAASLHPSRAPYWQPPCLSSSPPPRAPHHETPPQARWSTLARSLLLRLPPRLPTHNGPTSHPQWPDPTRSTVVVGEASCTGVPLLI
jgi:hypothetical protein